MKEVKAYRCDFCGKVIASKGPMSRHEAACSKNPTNKRACFGCRKCQSISVCVEINDREVDKVIPFCTHYKMNVIPPKAERNNNRYSIIYKPGSDEEFKSMFMKKECEFLDKTMDSMFMKRECEFLDEAMG